MKNGWFLFQKYLKNLMTELEHTRKFRRKETGEDFTPPELVSEMLDKLPSSCFTNPTKTFCDPAAGNGNFLVAILSRKLAAGQPPLQALSSVWGVELMNDNVEEMKARLLALLPNTLTPEERIEAQRIVDHNIICHNALTWDFENWKSKERHAKALFNT